MSAAVGVAAGLFLLLFLLAAGAELLARWWIRRQGGYYVFPPGLRLRLRTDRDVFPQLEQETRFEVNRDGERGDEVPRGADGLYRVLVAGGSQPEGYLLDQYTSWPGALHQLLQHPERLAALGASHAHVGSIARSGVGTEALALILRRVLPRYPRLQAIVILVGASDVFRWCEQGAPASPPSAVETRDVFRCHPEVPFGWTPGALALTEMVLRLRRRWLRPVQRHERAGAWMGRARAMRARATTVRTSVPDPAPMVGHFERHLRAALECAKAHADRVIVVRQPWWDRPCTPDEPSLMWHGGVGRAWQDEVTEYYSNEVLSQLMALVDVSTSRVAADLGIQSLNLRPLLRPSVETYYDLCHCTPAGARIVATAVAAAVLQQPIALSDPAGAAPLSVNDVQEESCAVSRAS